MFDKYQKMIVNGARDVIFLLVEEYAFESVDFELIGVGVAGTENSVTQRQ